MAMSNTDKILIADRYLADFGVNEIQDMNKENGPTGTSVEPRIMEVLEILVKAGPKVVSREELIEKVWDNYGGADDALNQAISHLRKILNDKDKDNRIIETVVKRGYRFVGSSSDRVEERHVKRSSFSWNILLAVAAIVIFILIAFKFMTNDNGFVPKAPVSEQDSTSNQEVTAPKAD